MKNQKKKQSSLEKTRKQIRKERRQLKKIKRNEYYSNKTKCKVPDTVIDEPNSKKDKIPLEHTLKQKGRNASEEVSSCTLDQQLKQKRKEDIEFKKIERKMKAQRARQMQEANEKEDKVIRALEKKLKLNRRKSKSLPSSFKSEGLDYLLEVCGYGEYRDSINLEKELQEAGDDFADNILEITGSKKNQTKNKTTVPQTKGTIEESSGEDDDMMEAENDAFDENDYSDAGEEEENIGEDDDERDSECDKELGDENILKRKHEGEKDMPEEKKFKEDIYGRLRDDKGNVIENFKEKYVPPQLRAKLSSDALKTRENVQKLHKQMKGFLNRLTESNMHSIATQMEDLYMKHSRHDVNFVLLKLLRESLITGVLSPERIVIEHAMLISILHANVGTEIGANVLQNIVEDFNLLLSENSSIEDKRIYNVVVFLCQLYNFKVFHACLVYDILKKFVDEFQERDIDLILIVLKHVGFNLRKDDPVSLKELIFNIQKKANESSELRENTRVRFMLDTLSAVKNNNMLKVQNYDPTYVDHLRKIQKSVLRQGKYVSELKISLEDLFNADTKGRWWIVGSAWTGDLGKRELANEDDQKNIYTFDQKILDLAKKQRMNTDTRRNIFCILMSAEDYVDAFEKLMKLGLKGQQYQEIIYVLMRCILKEKKYNPYYSYIAEQFCSVDRKYQLAIQFSTWDKFKDIDSLNNVQITNLAKFLSYLFLEQKLPLSILKVLTFTEMNKRMVRLIRQIMLAILLGDNEAVIAGIFSRISKSEKLFMLREGLQLFLHLFILKNVEKHMNSDCEEKMKLLPKRVELAENAMRGSSL